MVSKLTLSVDPVVVARAKHLAKERGTSVSRLVEAYLNSIAEPPAAEDIPPVLRSVRGILKNTAGRDDYRAHVTRKYK
ncbi:MAG: DUF6364 family protein [Bryobacteraceae bacterium]